jgi:hypothetical protein
MGPPGSTRHGITKLDSSLPDLPQPPGKVRQATNKYVGCSLKAEF